MVQTASQRTPDIICGKPNKPMFDILVTKYNIDPKKTLMIGDRLVYLPVLIAHLMHVHPWFSAVHCILHVCA